MSLNYVLITVAVVLSLRGSRSLPLRQRNLDLDWLQGGKTQLAYLGQTRSDFDETDEFVPPNTREMDVSSFIDDLEFELSAMDDIEEIDDEDSDFASSDDPTYDSGPDDSVSAPSRLRSRQISQTTQTAASQVPPTTGTQAEPIGRTPVTNSKDTTGTGSILQSGGVASRPTMTSGNTSPAQAPTAITSNGLQQSSQANQPINSQQVASTPGSFSQLSTAGYGSQPSATYQSMQVPSVGSGSSYPSSGSSSAYPSSQQTQEAHTVPLATSGSSLQQPVVKLPPSSSVANYPQITPVSQVQTTPTATKIVNYPMSAQPNQSGAEPMPPYSNYPQNGINTQNFGANGVGSDLGKVNTGYPSLAQTTSYQPTIGTANQPITTSLAYPLTSLLPTNSDQTIVRNPAYDTTSNVASGVGQTPVLQRPRGTWGAPQLFGGGGQASTGYPTQTSVGATPSTTSALTSYNPTQTSEGVNIGQAYSGPGGFASFRSVSLPNQVSFFGQVQGTGTPF